MSYSHYSSPPTCQSARLEGLSHPNIVRYHDSYHDVEDDVLYIIMEYCSLGDLSTVITEAKRRGQKISEPVVWIFFEQILSALAYCHRSICQVLDRGIVHRDLKPGNGMWRFPHDTSGPGSSH